MRSPLSICSFYTSDTLAQALSQYLRGVPPGEKVGGRYILNQFTSSQEFLNALKQESHHVDCLILEETNSLLPLLDQLQQQELLLPAVIIQTDSQADLQARDLQLDGPDTETLETTNFPTVFYHMAALRLSLNELSQIGFAIDQAISKFIQFSPASQPIETSSTITTELQLIQPTLSLKAQQVRLAEKLKERLGYLGVYYKRNPQNFLRHMTQPDREELLRQLKDEYREIILSYFSDESDLNQKIDNFVNIAFFADVPVSQVVEIHMDLMDEFSKQLKLEGRSDEILQDYRLTLIDTIAHLCEMYRRSIPRES